MIFSPIALVSLVRPKHWTKNAFVLVPLFLSFRFFDSVALLRAAAAFVVFCLAASAVYIGNDILDRERDRLHETKRLRPVASGAIGIPAAIVSLTLLAIAATAAAFALSPGAGFLVIAYLGLNAAYSFHLKRIPIVDVFILAAGFVLRVLVGAEVIGVPVSNWMILITIFLSLFLGFGKRRSEILAEGAGEHRRVLATYTPEVLTVYIMMCGVLTIVTYAFYTIDEEVASRFFAARLLYTIPLVAFGLFRYILLVIGNGEGGDVADLVLKDKAILCSLALWVGILLWAHQW